MGGVHSCKPRIKKWLEEISFDGNIVRKSCGAIDAHSKVYRLNMVIKLGY